jgi:hypothetical protein
MRIWTVTAALRAELTVVRQHWNSVRLHTPASGT